MAQKVKLTDLKVKSFVTELSQDQRKATKGGYFPSRGGGKTGIGSTQWSVNTMVDIRDGFKKSGISINRLKSDFGD